MNDTPNLTVTEAAASLGVSAGTLYRLIVDFRAGVKTVDEIIADGNVPAFRLGRQWRIQRSHIAQIQGRGGVS